MSDAETVTGEDAPTRKAETHGTGDLRLLETGDEADRAVDLLKRVSKAGADGSALHILPDQADTRPVSDNDYDEAEQLPTSSGAPRVGANDRALPIGAAPQVAISSASNAHEAEEQPLSELSLPLKPWGWRPEIARYSKSLLRIERYKCNVALRAVLSDTERALLRKPLAVGARMNVRAAIWPSVIDDSFGSVFVVGSVLVLFGLPLLAISETGNVTDGFWSYLAGVVAAGIGLVLAVGVMSPLLSVTEYLTDLAAGVLDKANASNLRQRMLKSGDDGLNLSLLVLVILGAYWLSNWTSDIAFINVGSRACLWILLCIFISFILTGVAARIVGAMMRRKVGKRSPDSHFVYRLAELMADAGAKDSWSRADLRQHVGRLERIGSDIERFWSKSNRVGSVRADEYLEEWSGKVAAAVFEEQRPIVLGVAKPHQRNAELAQFLIAFVQRDTEVFEEYEVHESAERKARWGRAVHDLLLFMTIVLGVIIIAVAVVQPELPLMLDDWGWPSVIVDRVRLGSGIQWQALGVGLAVFTFAVRFGATGATQRKSSHDRFPGRRAGTTHG